MIGSVYVSGTGGEGVYIRRTPNLDDRLSAWPEGTRFDVTRNQFPENGTNWMQVRAPSGQEGYVPAQYVSSTPPTPVPVTPTRAPSPPTAAPVVSLPNGTAIVQPSYRRGLGELTIANGTDRDATAKLRDAMTGRTLAHVYIRAKGETTLRDIGVGTYVLQFQTGVDWNQGDLTFRRELGTSEFDDRLTFMEDRTATGTRYSTFRVTLNAVPGGTARTHGIDPGAFAGD